MTPVLIKGGRIVDGAGNPWFRGDVRTGGEYITEIGLNLKQKDETVIDAKGKIICPGFFDMHSHSEYPLLVDGEGHSKIRQGITTDVTGESTSPAPLKGLALEEARLILRRYDIEPTWRTMTEYFKHVERKGISPNLVCLVGHSTVRQCVFGNEPREPTDSELDEMKDLVAQAMEEGAFGLASSLSHPPGNYAEHREFTELCKVVRSKNGYYSRHLRDEGDHILDALKELIDVGEASGCPVEVLHIKIAGEHNWRKLTPLLLKAIEDARARGVDITANQYPYEFGSAGLANCMPYWSRQGGTNRMVERLRNPETRMKIRSELEAGWPGSWLKETQGEWKGVIVSAVVTEANFHLQGKSIEEIGAIRGVEPVEAFFDVLIEENGTVTALYKWVSDDDISEIMQKPWVSFCTDGSAIRPEGILGEGHPHPRYYGTYAKILSKYVRERKVITLENAIRKATSLSAQRLGIQDRGIIKKGMYADINVFNPETVVDTATYQQPHQYPIGIDYVLVNGEIVIDKGNHTRALPGRVLKSFER
jgi:N-acyl-D-aspartate/D-glutamate deacylase